MGRPDGNACLGVSSTARRLAAAYQICAHRWNGNQLLLKLSTRAGQQGRLVYGRGVGVAQ